jgi:hypothetical protein
LQSRERGHFINLRKKKKLVNQKLPLKEGNVWGELKICGKKDVLSPELAYKAMWISK